MDKEAFLQQNKHLSDEVSALGVRVFRDESVSDEELNAISQRINTLLETKIILSGEFSRQEIQELNDVWNFLEEMNQHIKHIEELKFSRKSE